MISRDDEHLNLLKLFYYIFGGLGVCFSFFPLVQVSLGLMLLSGTDSFDVPPDNVPEPVGIILIVLFGIMFLIGQLISWLLVYAGRCLGQRKNINFSMIVAIICCLFFPFGTLLGVFTLIVLSRESVKKIYENSRNSDDVDSNYLADEERRFDYER